MTTGSRCFGLAIQSHQLANERLLIIVSTGLIMKCQRNNNSVSHSLVLIKCSIILRHKVKYINRENHHKDSTVFYCFRSIPFKD